MKRLFLIFLLVFVLASPSWATIYYVDIAVGDDGNTGTSEGAGNAWQNISKAMQTVAAGDTVYVKGGESYIEEDGVSGTIGDIITLGTEEAPILFEGYTVTPGDGTFACVTFDAGANGLTYVVGNSSGNNTVYYTFKFLRFTGSAADALERSERTTFIYCRFDNCGGPVYSVNTYLVTLFGCQIDNNAGYGISLFSGSILNCTIFANGNYGIFNSRGIIVCECIIYDHIITNADFSTAVQLISNCTINGGGISGGIVVGGANTKIYNNIITRCTTGISALAGSENTQISKNNLFFSNTTDKTNWPDDPSDINADPLFLDADANDYRLRLGSPAIQGGIDAGEIVNEVSYIDVGAHQKSARPLRVRAQRHGQ